MADVLCLSSLKRQWREEPWGFPARPQAAILSLKFPAGVTNPTLTSTYRLLLAAGWTFWIFWSVFGFDGERSTDWFIYVTHWTAAVMGGYMWTAFVSTLLPHVQWLDTAAWFLHGIAAPLPLMVTVLFWATNASDPPSGVTTIHLHGINALLMIMDLAISRYPYQLKHFPAPLAFILAYLVFNFTYWSYTRVVVYPSLDYDYPGGALIMICATLFGLFPFCHLLLWRCELACFVLSERLRHNAHAHKTVLAVNEKDLESGAPVKPTAAAARPPLALSDATLAMRSVEEAEAPVQTPSTLETSGGGGEGMEVSPAVAGAAVVTAA